MTTSRFSRPSSSMMRMAPRDLVKVRADMRGALHRTDQASLIVNARMLQQSSGHQRPEGPEGLFERGTVTVGEWSEVDAFES